MKSLLFASVIAIVGALAACTTVAESSSPTGDALSAHAAPVTKENLGARLFVDTNLSEPAGLSCSTCHVPGKSFVDARAQSTSEGAVVGRFGQRNAPSIVYAAYESPLLPASGETGYQGGMFWDGRVDTMQEQALQPLTNPLEMNNADASAVFAKLKSAAYASQFIAVYGPNALDDADTALANLADAVVAYETALPGYDRFSSKYDAYLAGTATFTDAEARGFKLYEDEKTGPCTPQMDGSMAPPCGCAQCHLDQPQDDGTPPMFTDFGYDNIGIPFNASNPFYQLPSDLNPGGPTTIDQGLGAVVPNSTQVGHFKAPTIRNVALTAPYGHNGYFKTLKDIVHFYNTRDVAGAWPAPEQPDQMNATGLGNLKLTSDEEDDLIAFLGTLSDGYTP